MYLDGARSISVVTDHATLTHLLKQPSLNLTKRQARYVEQLMPYAGYIKLLYRKRLGKRGRSGVSQTGFLFYLVGWRSPK